MHFTLRPISFAVGCGLALSLALPAQAQPQNWRATHSHAPDASDFTPGAEMRSGDTLHVAVSLQLRNREQLEAFAAGLMSGQATTPLTSEQFLSRYAPAAADVPADVAEALTSSASPLKSRRRPCRSPHEWRRRARST